MAKKWFSQCDCKFDDGKKVHSIAVGGDRVCYQCQVPWAMLDCKDCPDCGERVPVGTESDHICSKKPSEPSLTDKCMSMVHRSIETITNQPATEPKNPNTDSIAHERAKLKDQQAKDETESAKLAKRTPLKLELLVEEKWYSCDNFEFLFATIQQGGFEVHFSPFPKIDPFVRVGFNLYEYQGKKEIELKTWDNNSAVFAIYTRETDKKHLQKIRLVTRESTKGGN